MTLLIRIRLLVLVVVLAVVSPACGSGDNDDAHSAALAASSAADKAAANARQHKLAGDDYYADVFEAFERADAAAGRGDAETAAVLYRDAAAHAVAATNVTSAVEASTAYPLPEGLSDPSCTRFAHFHPETSCHFHVTRPACHPEFSLIYQMHDPAEETGHRYSTIPSCPTPDDAAEVTKAASAAVLAWQQAVSAANAASDEWETRSQAGK